MFLSTSASLFGSESFVCVVQCAGREQLEHLQLSPLTAAQHMAGPGEGWVLSPGKVLTNRQERRGVLTLWGEGRNSWTSAPDSFILLPPPHSRRDTVVEPRRKSFQTGKKTTCKWHKKMVKSRIKQSKQRLWVFLQCNYIVTTNNIFTDFWLYFSPNSLI